MSRDLRFMARTDLKNQPIMLIRLLIEEGSVRRQHVWQGDKWVSWPHLDWTGAGGAADWETVDEETARRFTGLSKLDGQL